MGIMGLIIRTFWRARWIWTLISCQRELNSESLYCQSPSMNEEYFNKIQFMKQLSSRDHEMARHPSDLLLLSLLTIFLTAIKGIAFGRLPPPSLKESLHLHSWYIITASLCCLWRGSNSSSSNRYVCDNFHHIHDWFGGRGRGFLPAPYF